MTVGELVYKQAVEQGYNPDFAKGLVSPLNKAMESYQKVFEDMKEPLKVVNRVVDSIRPQLEAMSKISFPILPSMPSFPTIPASFYDVDDELIIPAFTRPIQEVRITNPEDITGVYLKREREITRASYILPQNGPPPKVAH
jgi:hypothetical protein